MSNLILPSEVDRKLTEFLSQYSKNYTVPQSEFIEFIKEYLYKETNEPLLEDTFYMFCYKGSWHHVSFMFVNSIKDTLHITMQSLPKPDVYKVVNGNVTKE